MRFIWDLFLLLILSFFFISCSQTDVSVDTLNQVSTPSIPPQLISILDLPFTSSSSLQKLSDPVLITPEDGGVITVTNAYKAANGRNVSITLTLTFESGSVAAATIVTIKLDQRKAMAQFFPEGTAFIKPAFLDARLSGMDFSSLPKNSNIALFYIGNSNIEKIISGSLTWDTAAGTLTCRGAEIPHFSIYGFGFTK